MNQNKHVHDMTKILTNADALQASNTVKGVPTKNITLKQIDRAIKYPNFEWEDTEFVKLPNREQVVGIKPDPVPEGEEIPDVATSSRSGSTDSTKKKKKKSKKPKPAPHESIYPSPAVGLMHNPLPKTTGKKKKGKKKGSAKEEEMDKSGMQANANYMDVI